MYIFFHKVTEIKYFTNTVYFQEADLRSAVCVEQAAHAFLRIHPSMTRKYALHLILAGHRYGKVAQVGGAVGGATHRQLELY